MKREWATLGVMALFGASLAATSKPRGHGTPGSSASIAIPMPSDTSAASALVELPDTTTWKPYISAATKLTARTPPGATVSCTKTRSITVCTVARGMNIFSFSGGGRGRDAVARDLKRPKPSGTTTVIYESSDALIVHRTDPAIGEWCEYVTTSEPKLLSAAAHIDGTDTEAFKTIAPKDQDCLDVVAFAGTLKSTP